MNYDPGSPLGARQSGEFIIVFIIGAIILAILAGIYVIVHSIQKKHLTKEWIEAQKKKPTSQKDIRIITKDANLTKDERDLLVDICRMHNNVNIIYIVQNADDFDSLFKEIYGELSKSGKRAKQIAILFTLKEKMERFYRKDFVITSTKNIAAGQMIQFADKAGVHCSAKVSENRVDSISVALPLNIANGKNKPDALSRVAFTFTAKNGITYLLNTRVIRYQFASDGSTEMLISHTNDIKQLQRRQSQRISIGNPCSFSAVKVTSKANSQKNELVYTPMQTKYNGFLQDISSGGCRLQASLPIREGQYIHLEFSLKGESSIVTGIIIHTTKDNVPGKFLLHIQFVKLDIETRNTILAMVNHFI